MSYEQEYVTEILVEIHEVTDRFDTGEVASTKFVRYQWVSIPEAINQRLNNEPGLLIVPLSSEDMGRFSKTMRTVSK